MLLLYGVIIAVAFLFIRFYDYYREPMSYYEIQVIISKCLLDFVLYYLYEVGGMLGVAVFINHASQSSFIGTLWPSNLRWAPYNSVNLFLK